MKHKRSNSTSSFFPPVVPERRKLEPPREPTPTPEETPLKRQPALTAVERGELTLKIKILEMGR